MKNRSFSLDNPMAIRPTEAVTGYKDKQPHPRLAPYSFTVIRVALK